MGIKSFRGGVHPPERKQVSPMEPVLSVFPSTKLVWIPVTHGGAPNTPIVKVGDIVTRGQRIAESDSFMSAPVHASVSGKVKKIENHFVAGNADKLCICIQMDELQTEAFLEPLDPFTATKEACLARIRDCGIMGMGGACFPTHVKLAPPKGTVIDYVLANGAECEPYVTTDAATMFHEAEKVFDGIAIVMHITGAKQGILVVEDNKKDIIPTLEKALASLKQDPLRSSFDIRIQLCHTKYPQGGEKTLVETATGRQVPSGSLPFHVGCAIQNVGTMKTISEAFRLGKPLIDRQLTVGGGACSKPVNILAPMGTCVGDLIPEIFSLTDSVAKIILGGPMMGIAMKNADFPIQKNTTGLLFVTEREVYTGQAGPCIGCGKCVSVCPCRLSPVLMVRSLKASKLEAATRCGLMDCVECGACAFICPARINLVQWFKIGKQSVRAEMQRQKEKEEAKKLKAAALQMAESGRTS